MGWVQLYDPLGNPWLSTAVAALPIVILLAALGVFEVRAHLAALFGLISALAVAILVYGMPASTAAATAVYGAAYGLLPISWIVFSSILMYRLAVDTGKFEIIRDSIGALTRPVDIATWESSVRTRFQVLADLDDDEQRWATCDMHHRREVTTALGPLRSQ